MQQSTFENCRNGSRSICGPVYDYLFGMLAGVVFSAVTFSRERTILHLVLASFLILVASKLDAHLTSDIRPQNFFTVSF